MIDNLADIEALVLRCRTDDSKQYISEAILSYSAGAYRSAIVSTWVAVVFDLIDKIKELAMTGDAKATKEKEQYETYIKQIEDGNKDGERSASNYERNILLVCRDQLELLDAQQYIDLVRLREDRCRCAHPSFQMTQGVPFRPSAEQARVHIRNAIVYVLSQPPIQGKSALQKLTNIVRSEYFPIEALKAQDQLKETELKNASDSLINSFIDTMLYSFINKEDSLFGKKRVIAAINGALRLYPSEIRKRLTAKLNQIITSVPDDCFFEATNLSTYVEGAWDLLNIASKEKIYRYIDQGKLSDVIKLLDDLANLNNAKPKVMERIANITLDELQVEFEKGYLATLIVEAAINRLSKVQSWPEANKVIKKIIFKIYDRLTKDDMKELLNLQQTSGADLDGAFEFDNLISRVRRTHLLTDKEIIDVVGEETFNRLFQDKTTE